MAFSRILDEVYAAFQQRSADARVVLLHFRSRYRTALLSRLLGETRVCYYAMGTDDVDVSSFVAGFTHDIADQYPAFGNYVNQAIARFPDNVEYVLDGFVADVSQLSDEPFLLILDEYDRADVDDRLQQFFELLIERLPTHCKLVISSRSLPRMPWMALIAQKKAVMLNDGELVASDFYDNQSAGQYRLTVNGFGPGAVLLDEAVVEGWEGHLPRLLLYFALERPLVTRSEICASFWPDLSTDQAVNVFHVTKRRLHKALEGVGIDILTHENGFYRVNPVLSIHYDVVDFVGALVQGRLARTAKQAAPHWQRAIELYNWHFLQGHTESWILGRRADYQTGYIEALQEMAHIRARENRPEPALLLLQKALNENDRRQDLHRDIMALYADMGRRSETASHYQKMLDTLARAGLEVEPETVAVYNELMSG